MTFKIDQRGAIWQLDLSFSHTQLEPAVIEQFHGGSIRGICASPVGHLTVSTGDNQVRVTDVSSRQVVAHMKFNAAGSSVDWVNESTVIAGFDDGTVRILTYGLLNKEHS
jgi:WD40 repeat protein